ncbi:MAG: hypothetical protein ACRD0I_00270 [Acidimicrobiales bacterium]
MNSVVWPSDDGWPYPDDLAEVPDPDGEVDEDALCLQANRHNLLRDMSPLEQLVLARHFGLDGGLGQSMRQLHDSTGLDRADLSAALGSGIDKLRLQLG